MIAIAWVDTVEGRHWVAVRAGMMLIAGSIALTFGWLVDAQRLVWIGATLGLLGAVSIGWAFLHRDRGLPLRRVESSMADIPMTRPCIVPECQGTMTYHEPREVADAPHTLEWPWYGSWSCSQDPTHSELVVDFDTLVRSDRGETPS